MAKGDVVSGIGSALSTELIFQPASGVEIIITMVGNYTTWTYLYNGTTQSNLYNNSLSSSGEHGMGNMPHKICINNTNYLKIAGDPSFYPSYTGIQIK
jgi:hypothetical protein